MNCREMQAVLPGLAEREGTPRVALHAARHLATCPSCAEALLRLREVNGLLDRLPQAEVPSSFARRILRALPRDARWGASVALFLALGWWSAALPSAAFPASIADWLATRLQTASDALATGLSLLLDLLAVARAALATLPPAPVAFPPGFAPPLSQHLLGLAAVALMTFFGSWAAFARGALRFRRERRLPRPPLP